MEATDGGGVVGDGRFSDVSEQTEAAEVLVAEILALDEPARTERLEGVCRDNPSIADAVRRLVAEVRQIDAWLDHEVGAGADDAAPAGFPDGLGDFRLIERVGAGGMGVVYRAEQRGLGRIVALKVIRPEYLYFPKARQRFRREVETIARLQHPGIVPVFSVGEDAGVPYFAMEFIEGCTLADVLEDLAGADPSTLSGADIAAAVGRRAGWAADDLQLVQAEFRESWTNAWLGIGRQVAEALEHAHARGVIHRDIKPSNLMVTRGGRVMLVDFGLASAEGTEKLTRSQTPIGSLIYMSPEVFTGGVVGSHSDVYSLAVTLYECIGLRHPFAAVRSSRELQDCITNGRAAPLRRFRPFVPRRVSDLIQRAMAVDHKFRFQTASSFAEIVDAARRDDVRLSIILPFRLRIAIFLGARHHLVRGLKIAAASLLTFLAILGWREFTHGQELQRTVEALRAANAAAKAEAQATEAAIDAVLLAVDAALYSDTMQREHEPASQVEAMVALLEDNSRITGPVRVAVECAVAWLSPAVGAHERSLGALGAAWAARNAEPPRSRGKVFRLGLSYVRSALTLGDVDLAERILGEVEAEWPIEALSATQRRDRLGLAGMVLANRGRLADAARAFDEAAADIPSSSAAERRLTLEYRFWAINCAIEAGDVSAAKSNLEAARGVVDAIEAPISRTRSTLLLREAALCRTLNDKDGCLKFGREALRQATLLCGPGSTVGVNCARFLGDALLHFSDAAAAHEVLEAALPAAAATGRSPLDRADLLNIAAAARRIVGDLSGAAAAVDESLALQTQIPGSRRKDVFATTLVQQATIAIEQGDVEAATSAFWRARETSLTYCADVIAYRWQADSGLVACLLLDQQAEHAREIIRPYVRSSDVAVRLMAQSLSARSLVRCGDVITAQTEIAEALRDVPPGVALSRTVNFGAADVSYYAGDVDAAREFAECALPLKSPHEQSAHPVAELYRWMEAAVDSGHAIEVLPVAMRAREAIRRGSPFLEQRHAQLTLILARCLADAGQLDRAMTEGRDAMLTIESLPAIVGGGAELYRHAAIVMGKCGDWDNAQTWATRALQVARGVSTFPGWCRAEMEAVASPAEVGSLGESGTSQCVRFPMGPWSGPRLRELKRPALDRR